MFANASFDTSSFDTNSFSMDVTTLPIGMFGGSVGKAPKYKEESESFEYDGNNIIKIVALLVAYDMI